jgi:hypothetical protein
MILPGTNVVIDNPLSIYNGYEGFVQRIESGKYAILFDNYAPWEKLVTFSLKDLKEKEFGRKR